MKRLLFAVLLLPLVVLSACSRSDTPRKIVILSTNDIHAAIQNFPRLATAVEMCRDTAEVILVDAGDRWTGNAYVDHAPEKCRPVIDLMNLLDYDVATLGNHEFDHGQQLLDQRIEQADFDVICANMSSSTPYLHLDPTEIVECGGIRVGFVGLVTNFANGHPDGKEVNFEGLTFPSPFETAAEYQSLADQCDLLVAITHIGSDMDTLLVDRAPGYDLIIGGHTHTVIPEGKTYGHTMITQTGKSLKYIGATEVEMRGDTIYRIYNRLIPLDGYAEDPQMKSLVEQYYNDPELNKAIGSSEIRLGIVGLANFMAAAITQATDSQIGFYHFGGVRIDSLRKDSISIGDMYTLEPFSSTIYTVEMSGAQMREMIINKFNDTKNPKESHRPDLNPYGTSYTILTDENGDATDVRFDAVDYDKVYKVALCNYIYENYRFDKSVPADNTGILVTDVLCDQLRNSSPLKYDNRLAITIEPQKQ